MAKTVADVMKMVKENEVKFVDFRFTDTRGKQQHTTVPVSHFDEDKFSSGHAFDGSSIAGWKGIEASDMLLMPDPNTANIDPFFEETTIIMNCDVVEPSDGKAYDRDPRSIAKRAEAYLKASGIGDAAYFGPEPEFFIFDGVRWSTEPNNTFYEIEEYEAPWNTGSKLEGGNRGHRPTVKGGYFPVPPVDSTQDMRAEMSLILESLGIPVEVFHHEVAGAGQNEIGTRFSTLVERADWTMLQKYVVHNVANAYGKTATFMPKPYHGDNGSGMHVHQSVWKDGKNLFAGDGYAGLSGFRPVLHRRHHQARPCPERHHQPWHQQLQAPGSPLRSAGEAGLLGQEPFRVHPHSVCGQPQGPSRGSPLPRSTDEPLPGLCCLVDGGSGRRGKQDPSRRSSHQGPLPSASRGRCKGTNRVPQPGSGAGASGQGPRIPDQGWCVHRQHAGCLHRTQDV
jgi:hypothetical protein